MEKMKIILQENDNKPLKEGEVVEGKVIAKDHLILYVDLGKKGIGAILGKEFLESKEQIKQLKIGDRVIAKVVNCDGEDGLVELSFKGAERELKIREFEEMKERGEKIKVKIVKANRGGLVGKFDGFSVFLPISQISQSINNFESPLEELKKFVGKEMEVKILNVLKSGQLIVSEKLAKEESESQMLGEGEVVEGEIVGVTDFGFFVKTRGGEGILPKSEIPENFSLKIGDKVNLCLKEKSQNRLLFSLFNTLG